MADVKQDLFTLEYSPGFEIQGTQEANIDLELTAANTNSATVYGTVTDGTSPIANATVKLFDSVGLPYKHTLTDASGSYFLTDIPAGTYSLAAVADGYLLSDAAGITLSNGAAIQTNLICAADTTLNLGTIAGVLSVTNPDGTFTPLSEGKITLKDSAGETIASTFTAADGEFAFYDLADGTYTLISAADGYLPASSMTAVIINGSIINITMTMTKDSRTYSGTVSGIIRDNAGQTIAGCFVGLYQVTEIAGVKQENLIAVTKTNSAGKYLFGDVLAGSYVVKAKMEF